MLNPEKFNRVGYTKLQLGKFVQDNSTNLYLQRNFKNPNLQEQIRNNNQEAQCIN